GIFAFNYICYGLWKAESFFLRNHAVLNHVDGYIIVNKTKNVQIHKVKPTVYLYNVFFPHFVAFGIFDYGHAAVQLAKSEIIIYIHALSCLYVVNNKAVFQFSYVQHGKSTSRSLRISAMRTYTPNC